MAKKEHIYNKKAMQEFFGFNLTNKEFKELEKFFEDEVKNFIEVGKFPSTTLDDDILLGKKL